MYTEISVPYGHETRSIRVPTDNLAWVTGPKLVPPVEDLEEAVVQAMRNPIGSATLAEIVAEHGRNVMILADDNTRSTPQTLILPLVLNELNAAGVRDEGRGAGVEGKRGRGSGVEGLP